MYRNHASAVQTQGQISDSFVLSTPVGIFLYFYKLGSDHVHHINAMFKTHAATVQTHGQGHP
jgi:hypothetical protein